MFCRWVTRATFLETLAMNRPLTILLITLAPACTHPAHTIEQPMEDRVAEGATAGTESAQPSTFSVREELKGDAARAYDYLVATQRFTDDAIYDGGALPKEVICVRILLQEPRAAQIFQELAYTGSMGTRLYALCGLYYADPTAFELEIPRIRETEALIEFQTGCSTLLNFPVKDLVDLGAGNAVRLESREQTIRAWKLEDEARFSLRYDIAGGGFPNLFRTGGGYGEIRKLDLEQGAD